MTKREKEYQVLMANVIRGVAPPPSAIRFALGKGIKPMKAQARKIEQLRKSGKLKDPMVDWMSKPRLKP